MRKIVTIAAMLLAAGPVRAANWELALERAGEKIFVDRETLRSAGAITRATLRFEFPGEVPASGTLPAHRSSLEVRRFDCAAKSYDVTRSVVYASPGAEGKPLRVFTAQQAAMEVPAAGTPNAAVVAAICRISAR